MAIISFFKKLSPFASANEQRDIHLLEQHGVFDRGYYQQQLPAWQRVGWLRPELHFLRIGWRVGLTPTTRFDVSWYVDRYPDVGRARMNPLLHFLRYGVHEGRLPSQAGHISDFPLFQDQAIWLHHQAWHGHAGVAVPKLRALAEQGELKARWYLAGWYYGQSRYEQALFHLHALLEALLQRSTDDKTGLTQQTISQALVKCYVRLQQSAKVTALLEQPDAARDELDQAMFHLAAVDLSWQQRLAPLNQWLARRDLVTLTPPAEASRGLGGLSTRRVRAKARKRMPLVSIVVPAFNAEHTIDVALTSLLAQSWPSIEIIVVDDASTDGTARHVENKARLEPKLTLIRHEKNGGAYRARNTGVQAARGAFVTVHDSDDWSHPQKIERQVLALMRHATVMATQSFWIRVNEHLQPLGPWHLCAHWLEPNPASVMVRREVFDTLGLWDGVAVAADNEFVERLQKHYGQEALMHVVADVPLAFSLVQAASLTQRKVTHVRTIHSGVRHLYHQGAAWWRGRQVVPVMSNEGPRRLFPTPLGNQPRPCLDYDIAVVADVSARNPELMTLLTTLLRCCHEGYRVVICPWSQPTDFSTRWLADDMWELCHEEGIAVAHSGLRLRCGEVRVQASGDSCDWPDDVPMMVSQEGVRDLLGKPLPVAKADALASYLAGGGRSVL